MNMRIPATAIVASALALTLGACGGEVPTTTVIDDPSAGDFTISVSDDAPPRLSWPGPGAFRISVESVADGEILWRIRAVDQDVGIPPPVTFGTSPVGAEEEIDEGQLEANQEYRVRVTRIDGRSATRDFTP